jgi:hypothetical protein
MMAHSVTGPSTVAMIRDIHNDDVSGLTLLADRQVEAYRRWHQRIARTRELLLAAPVEIEKRQLKVSSF